MPVQTTYPGVYIIEQKSGSHVITGISTSKTAFVGVARKGPADTPTQLSSFADYTRVFGDVMDTTRPMGHSVQQYFANGGSQAIIVRALDAAAPEASLTLPAVQGLAVRIAARSRGAWANGTGGINDRSGMFVEVQASSLFPKDRFSLVLTEWTRGAGGGPANVVQQETWSDLSMSPTHPRYAVTALAASTMVTVQVTGVAAPAPAPGSSEGLSFTAPFLVSGKTIEVSIDQGPAVDHVLFPTEAPSTSHTAAEVRAEIALRTGLVVSAAGGIFTLTSTANSLDSAVVVGLVGLNDASADLRLGVNRGGTEVSGSAPYRPAVVAATPMASGNDGAAPGAADIVSSTSGRGLLALDVLDFPRFNILCLPGVTTADSPALDTAMDYCRRQSAFLVVDPEPGLNPAQLKTAANLIRAQGAHGAIYWPRLKTADSGTNGFGPSGAVAGIMARTDASRGIWKAPAGLDAGVAGVLGPVTSTNDDISGDLNPLGLNVLRTFPGAGLVVWGARTLAGSDVLSSDSKYVPVRRLTDYLSASLYIGTQFAVFEPNDTGLWGQLRLAVGEFMRGLFLQGAFQLSEKHADSDSYFVICDSTVNPQTEIDAGRVNVVVGFAPRKPAEFVVITITQISQAGD